MHLVADQLGWQEWVCCYPPQLVSWEAPLMPGLLSTARVSPVAQAHARRATVWHAPKASAAPPPQPARMLGRPPRHSRSMESLKHRYAAVPGAQEGGAAPGAEQPSLAPVFTAVAVAGLGAFSFGYHLGVVNGPLAAIATDLGFAGNASLQGLVRRRRRCCC